MDYYLDIKLRPDPEFTPELLMSALFGKLHRTLATHSTTDVGVSFPGYQLKPCTPGDVLRLHGTGKSLDQLMARAWLCGMTDHIVCSEILPVPAETQYRNIHRRQLKTNVDRLRRRRMKRKDETWEQAVEAIPSNIARTPHLPYITLTSRSTGQKFNLYIELGDQLSQSVQGDFNTYGLAQQATVPWF